MQASMATTTVTGTIDRSHADAMTIDEAGMAHIMGVLTNLYSDKNLAVLREYSTNALDSHIAAGIDRPIEVTLPSPLNPTLVVRDFGVGLSRDEIVQVYSRYGASTKRDTNSQIGAFGLGCKSALTITDQYVVTGVKDGRKTVALFAVNEQGVGTRNILSETDTDEPNGVLVSIGVPDPSGMARSAEAFFATWPPGTVLVDGAAPESAYADALRLSDGLHITSSGTTAGGLVMVMGPVGYPASRALLEKIRENNSDPRIAHVIRGLLPAHNRAVLADAPVGSVDITPSREALRDTPRTTAAVTEVLRRIAEAVEGFPQQEADDSATITEAVMRADSAKRRVVHWLGRTSTGNPVTWKGEPLADHIACPLRGFRLAVTKGRRVCYATDRNADLHPEDLSRITVVTGVPESKSMRLQARRFLLSRGDSFRVVLLTDQPAGQRDWFAWGDDSPVETITVAEFLAEAAAFTPDTSARKETKYAVRLPDGQQENLVADEVNDLDGTLFFLRHSDRHDAFVSEITADASVVTLSAQQSVKCLKERVPSVQDAAAAGRASAKAFMDSVPARDLSLIDTMGRVERDSYEVRKLLDFLGDRLDDVDPDSSLRVWIDAVQRDEATIDADRPRLKALSDRVRCARSVLGESAGGTDHDERFLQAHLPLLDVAMTSFQFNRVASSGPAWDHLIAYVNSVRPEQVVAAAA